MELDDIPQMIERNKLRGLNKQVSGHAQKMDSLCADINKVAAKVDLVAEELAKKKVHFSDTVERQDKIYERLDALE